MGFQGFDGANRRAAPGWRRRSLGGLTPDPRAAVKPRRRRRAQARSGLTASPDQAAGKLRNMPGTPRHVRPFWKRATRADGSVEGWVEAKADDEAQAERWGER